MGSETWGILFKDHMFCSLIRESSMMASHHNTHTHGLLVPPYGVNTGKPSKPIKMPIKHPESSQSRDNPCAGVSACAFEHILLLFFTACRCRCGCMCAAPTVKTLLTDSAGSPRCEHPCSTRLRYQTAASHRVWTWEWVPRWVGALSLQTHKK